MYGCGRSAHTVGCQRSPLFQLTLYMLCCRNNGTEKAKLLTVITCTYIICVAMLMLCIEDIIFRAILFSDAPCILCT